MKRRFFSLFLLLSLLWGNTYPLHAAPASPANALIFLDSGQRLPLLYAPFIAFGDLDGDGAPDYYADHIWLNNGKGLFTQSKKAVGAGAGKTYAVTLADVDGDKDLDVLIVKNSFNLILLNDGTGNFTNSGQIIQMATGATNAIGTGDLDGDGDVDAYFGDRDFSNNPDEVWLNNGSGIFTDTLQRLGNDTSYNVAVADVNNDKKLDVIVTTCGGEFNESDRVWLNDGTGKFSDSGQTFDSACTVPLIAQDLDGDQDVDLIIGKTGSDRGSFAFWKNNGAGQFSKVATFTSTGDPLAGDIDGDQDVDIVSSDGSVFLNDGQGNFTKSAQTLPTGGTFLLDVNGDGKLDLIRNTATEGQVWLQINPTGAEDGVYRSLLPLIQR